MMLRHPVEESGQVPGDLDEGLHRKPGGPGGELQDLFHRGDQMVIFMDLIGGYFFVTDHDAIVFIKGIL
jgi:hypothetical protein